MGNGEWGMGNGDKKLFLIPHSPLPIPHSPTITNLGAIFSMNIYYDKDADPKALAGKRIAVIGYGSQGFGHSNNLKDSGCDVVVGLRSDSPSVAKAQSAGLEVLPVADAAERGDVVMVLTPDELTPGIYKREIEPHLKPGKYLAVAHGF